MSQSNEALASAIDDMIAKAIRELDLEQKVELLTGAAAFSLHGNEAIGLRPMIFSDGPTGVRGSEFVGGKKVALFPNATLLAQAWDETAAERVGEMLAGEGRSQGVDVVLGPTVNLHRAPLGWPAVRGIFRGSAAQWSVGRGLHQGHPAIRRWSLRQALRR